MNIDFFTFIGPNSADYAEYLKYTCELFISGKHKVNWKCIESVGAERLPKGFKRVAKAPNVHHNSLNHGTAMNTALKYIKSDYVVFIDADMAILYQDWDDIIVKELNRNDCFGAAYGHPIKYKNFPTIFLFAFRSYVLKNIHLDFRPVISKGTRTVSRIALNQDAKYFGMKPGEKLKRDTGWMLPLQFKKAGYVKSKAMPMILMFSKKAQLPFENEEHKQFCRKKPEHMCEWHYNRKIFASHKQASRVHCLNGKYGQAWKKRIDLYIVKHKR